MIKNYYKGNDHSPFFGAFRSEGYIGDATIPVEGHAHRLPMSSLPALLRTLLVTDGTVTKSLEAYFWEPVQVDVEKLDVIAAQEPIAWLEVLEKEQVLTRSVVLRGEHSNKHYASAFSLIRLSALSDSVKQALVSGEIGIGVLIRDSGLESYREIVDIKAHQLNFKLYQGDGPSNAVDVVSRTYRIIVNHEPVILISETFPTVHFMNEAAVE